MLLEARPVLAQKGAKLLVVGVVEPGDLSFGFYRIPTAYVKLRVVASARASGPYDALGEDEANKGPLRGD